MSANEPFAFTDDEQAELDRLAGERKQLNDRYAQRKERIELLKTKQVQSRRWYESNIAKENRELTNLAMAYNKMGDRAREIHAKSLVGKTVYLLEQTGDYIDAELVEIWRNLGLVRYPSFEDQVIPLSDVYDPAWIDDQCAPLNDLAKMAHDSYEPSEDVPF